MYYYDGNNLNITRDIYRGKLSSDPLGFFVLNDRIYFTASNVYYGKEVWFFQNTTCNDTTTDGIVVICSSTCVFENGTIYGETSQFNPFNITARVTLEGSLFVNNTDIYLSNDFTILGSLLINENLTITKKFGSALKVRNCLVVQRGNKVKLVINITAEEARQLSFSPHKFETLIEAGCITGQNFSKDDIILVVDGCTEVYVNEIKQDDNTGLVASFIVNDDGCKDYTVLLVATIVPSVSLIVIAGIILVALPCTRRIIFPHRLKNAEREKKKKEIGHKISSSENRSSTSTTPDDKKDSTSSGQVESNS